MRFSFFGFLLLLLPSQIISAQEKEFFFKPNDRVLFLGDSITEQYQYSSDIELYLTTRFPEWNLTFLNAGISGDTANGGASRYQTHVLAEKPTCVTINFGMNDGGYGKFDENRNKGFVNKTQEMLDLSKKAGIRVALISPNAVDTRIRKDFAVYLETQKQFYAPLKTLAEKNNVSYVDQYTMTRTVLETLVKENADKVVPFGDGFHTSSPGGLLMAHSILVGLNAPKMGSDMMIDVAGKTFKSEKCAVSKFEVLADGLSFDRKDESLPMPVMNDWVTLIPFLNNLNDFNFYGLKATGLPGKSYELSIDGVAVEKYTSEQLAKGVNLGILTKGPIHAQGMKVNQLINDKNKKIHDRFRNYIMYNPPGWFEELKPMVEAKKASMIQKIKDQCDAQQVEIYKLVKPVSHSYRLKMVDK